MALKTTYGDTMKLSYQNSKTGGSIIMNIDTIRGCPFKCESCYSRRNSSRTIQDFDTPVLLENLTGRVHADRQYRVGNSGDPCVDWAHSEELIKHYNIPNVFVVTKLLSIKGYSGYFDKLQVSVDPMNKTHFYKTLENVELLLMMFPKTKIVLRIRSMSTRRIDILGMQQEAVAFANMYNLPVLDTRMRFLKKDAIDFYRLNEDDYIWEGTAYRPKKGLIFLTGVQKYYDCDLYGNHCKNCDNCSVTWCSKQYKKKGEFISDHKNGTIKQRR